MDIKDIEQSIKGHEKLSLPWYLKLIKYVEIQPNEILLDVGCGGCLLSTLKKRKRKFRVVGLDNDGRMLRLARERAKVKAGIFLVKGDAFKMPFPTNFFDVVIACAFPHDTVGFTTTLIDEMARVLRPGGRFAMVEDVAITTGRLSMVCSRLDDLGLLAELNVTSLIAYATKPENLTVLPELPPYHEDHYDK